MAEEQSDELVVSFPVGKLQYAGPTCMVNPPAYMARRAWQMPSGLRAKSLKDTTTLSTLCLTVVLEDSDIDDIFIAPCTTRKPGKSDRLFWSFTDGMQENYL